MIPKQVTEQQKKTYIQILYALRVSKDRKKGNSWTYQTAKLDKAKIKDVQKDGNGSIKIKLMSGNEPKLIKLKNLSLADTITLIEFIREKAGINGK